MGRVRSDIWLSQLVPLSARGMLHYDLRGGILAGLFLGTTALLPMVVKQTLQASDWEVAVLVGAPAAGHLFSIYWAHLCYHRRKMPWVLWPGVISRAMFLLVAFLTCSVGVVIVAAVSNFVGSMSWPAFNSIQRNNYPGTHRYRVVAAVMAVSNLVVAGTSYGVGWVLRANPWHYRWLVPLAGLCGVASVLVFTRIKVRGERQLSEETGPDFSLVSSLRILLENRPFGLYMTFQMITGTAFLMSAPALVRHLHDLGATYDQSAIVLSTIPSILLIVTLPVWSRILHGRDPMQSRVVLCCFWGTGFALLGLSTGVWLVCAGQVVIGLASGGGALLWSLAQMHYASPKELPRYSGLHATLTGVRGMTAPYLGALLLTFTEARTVLLIVAGMMGLGVVYPRLLRLFTVPVPRGRDA